MEERMSLTSTSPKFRVFFSSSGASSCKIDFGTDNKDIKSFNILLLV